MLVYILDLVSGRIAGYTRNGAEREAVTGWALQAMRCRDVTETPATVKDRQ